MTLPDDHQIWREQLALYAVGRLPAVDERSLREHLLDCRFCSAELPELTAIADAVAAVDPDGLDSTARPSAGLEDRIVRAVRREARQTSFSNWTRVLAPVAAAVAAVGLFVVLQQPAAPPTEPVAVAVDEQGVEATASLIAHTWGTEIILVAEGLEDGGRYKVWFERADGRTVPAGTFIGIGAKPLTCRLNAALLRADARSFSVTDEKGATVMRATLPEPAPADA